MAFPPPVVRTAVLDGVEQRLVVAMMPTGGGPNHTSGRHVSVGGRCSTPPDRGGATGWGGCLGESVGVHVGKVCPSCGRAESIPLLGGLSNPEDVELAERGLV